MQKTNLLDNSDLKININQKLIREFEKPIFENRIFINKQLLITNSKKYEFNKISWVQNPQNFSFEIYGAYEYYRVILLVNGLGSYIQFKPTGLKNEYIIAPLIDTINRSLL